MRLLFQTVVFVVICALPSINIAQRNILTACAPVEVKVTMYVLGISNVCHKHMEFTMDLYLRQFWKDERLAYNSQSTGLDMIALDSLSGMKLWEPDTFFANEKNSFIHSIMQPNIFVRIHPDGRIFKSARISITASCPMNLNYFPMDSQVCTLELESYALTSSDIVYQWGDNNSAVGISPDVTLPSFSVAGFRTRNSTINLSTGSYSRLALDIQFNRSFGFYVLQVYLPVILLVMISWMTFLMKNALIRIAMAMATTLTLIVFFSLTDASIAKVSYVKALDVYTGFSLLIIFAILAIHVLVASQADADKIPPAPKVDKFAIVAFPVLFLFFNILYCIIYFSLSFVNINHTVK